MSKTFIQLRPLIEKKIIKAFDKNHEHLKKEESIGIVIGELYTPIRINYNNIRTKIYESNSR